MVRISMVLRLSLGLVSLAVGIVAAAASFGLVGDWNRTVLERHQLIGEALAVQAATAVDGRDSAAVQRLVDDWSSRNPEIASSAVRTSDGKFIAVRGEHNGHWTPMSGNAATMTQMQFLLSRDGAPFATVEVRFNKPRPPGISRWFGNPFYALLAFVALVGSISFTGYLYLAFRRAAQAGNSVVPQRVRTALDALTEGVIILDGQKRIALANESFSKLVGTDPEELRGRTIDDLPWMRSATEDPGPEFPWDQAQQELTVSRGATLAMRLDEKRQRLIAVNAAPILDEQGRCRGAMATFDDLTDVEKKNTRLSQLLKMLRESRDDMRKQNENLRLLATSDPLTSCLNRRAYFEEFDKLLAAASRYDLPLSCVMVDVDHFKQVNDTHGHGAGDQVLEAVGQTLRATVRTSDLVCRYGGEEFSVLLSHIDLDGAVKFAERIRAAIAGLNPAGIPVTASLGVSSRNFGSRTPGELVDQADKALYAAKRNGRNQVITWDKIPPGLEKETTETKPVAAGAASDEAIPSHAVNVLFSALMLRHPASAEHSQRVAQLVLALAEGRLGHGEMRLLEVAALLHDIGTIGLPDTLLQKGAAFDQEDWALMRTHQRYGVEVVRAAFACEPLNQILLTFRSWFNGHPSQPDAPRGESIPMESRILAIAEAYDSLTTDRPDRKALSPDHAVDKLAHSAGSQFDPSLIGPLRAVIAEPGLGSRRSATEERLRVSHLLEQLSGAVDAVDRTTVMTKVAEVRDAAEAAGLTEVANAAVCFQRVLAGRGEWDHVIECMLKLMHAFRAKGGRATENALSDYEIAIP